MKRRSGAGGVPSKARRQRTPEPKRRSAAKTASRPKSSSGAETEVARLSGELSEALARQSATSDVLQVISRSTGDLQPVFEAVLENAVRLSDARFGTINRWDGEALHLVATNKLPPAFAEFRKRLSYRPGPGNFISRMLLTKTIVHVNDLAAEQVYAERNPVAVAAVELGGVRTFLAVPMLKQNELIGVVIVYRQQVRPFTYKHDQAIALAAETGEHWTDAFLYRIRGEILLKRDPPAENLCLRKTVWWRTQSYSNPSPPSNSLLTGKLSGKIAKTWSVALAMPPCNAASKGVLSDIPYEN